MMMLAEAARALAAQLDGTDGAFDGVSTDSRTIGPGQLFIALHGERFDGHRFLGEAAAAGAAGAIVARERLLAAADRSAWAALPLIIVSDTRIALGKLAAHWRGLHDLPLVGLPGSSGKTTVKEMLACVLRAACEVSGGAPADDKVLATRGNLNNDIGVPLMLLELRPQHRYAVIEMGMNHAGEIRYLAQIASPDVAIVTNAGRAHIEYLGSEEAIARAKGEIYENLKEGATAVINADDAYAPMWREIAGERARIEFGLNGRDVSATYLMHPLASDITLRMPAGEAHVRMNVPGLHNVRNALAAAAVGVALDIPSSAIAAGLAQFAGVKGRLQRKTARGAVIIDDTYNANPDSVRAAIDVLAAAPGKRILVLADMGELGGRGPQLHAEIGAYARAAGIERLLLLGDLSANTAHAYGDDAQHYDNVEDLVARLTSELAPGVTALVKGSRFMRMERVVDALTTEQPQQ
jgi:UDP-N-acetylmuramoyl-tripeptide--D-alanyl-D-alanine ligase